MHASGAVNKERILKPLTGTGEQTRRRRRARLRFAEAPDHASAAQGGAAPECCRTPQDLQEGFSAAGMQRMRTLQTTWREILSLTLSVRRLVPLCSGGHHKYKRVVGLKTGDPASLYRLDGLTFLQGGEALQGGMNLYRSLPLRQMFAQSGGAAVGASDERILA